MPPYKLCFLLLNRGQTTEHVLRRCYRLVTGMLNILVLTCRMPVSSFGLRASNVRMIFPDYTEPETRNSRPLYNGNERPIDFRQDQPY